MKNTVFYLHIVAVILCLALISGSSHASRSWCIAPDAESTWYNQGRTWAEPASLRNALGWCSEGDTLYLKTGDYYLSSSDGGGTYDAYTILKDGLSLLGGFTGNVNNPLERSPSLEYDGTYGYDDIARSRFYAQSQNRIFLLNGVNDILFRDLLLSDGLAQFFSSEDTCKAGGAIYAENSQNITFQGVVFRNNRAYSHEVTTMKHAHGYGGAAFLRNTSANFINCKFSSNFAYTRTSTSIYTYAGKGGAIYADIDDIDDIDDQTATVAQQSSICIDNCRFEGNYGSYTSGNIFTTVSQGGAIYLNADGEHADSRLEVYISNSEFYGNKAFYGESLAGNAADGGAIYQGGNCSWLTLGHYNYISGNDNGLVVADNPEHFHFEKDEDGVHWGFIRNNYTTSANIYSCPPEEPDIWPDYTYTVHIPEERATQLGFILGSRDEHPANLNPFGSYEVPRECTLGIRLLRNNVNGNSAPALVFTNLDGSLHYIPAARTIPDMNNNNRHYVEYRYQSISHGATLSDTIPFTTLSVSVHDTTLLQHETFLLPYTVSPEEIVSVTRRSTSPDHVSFGSDGLVQALRPTPNGSPVLLITSIFINGLFVSSDTCKVTVLPTPVTVTPTKGYNYMPVLTDGSSKRFPFADIAKHTLCDLRPESGYTSRTGFDFSVKKANVDIHQLRTYNDNYFLHIAFRPPNTPGYFYRIRISDGFYTDSCIIADHCLTNEDNDIIAVPHYILPPATDEWHSLFIPLKRLFPRLFTHEHFTEDNNVSLATSVTPFISVSGLNPYESIAVDGIFFFTEKDLVTSVSLSPSLLFTNTGDLQPFTLSHTPSDLMPPDLICTNPDLLRISGPYGYKPGGGGTNHYTVFARNEGAGQLILSQDHNRFLTPVIISSAEKLNPLVGNTFYTFYAGQETANRLHATGFVAADLRPNTGGQPVTLISDENAVLLPRPNPDTDINSMGDTEDWLRFLTPAGQVSGVTFRTGNNFQPVSLTALIDSRDQAFLHIAYRLEDNAIVDRPTHPLIELTFTCIDGRKVILPIGQDYFGTNDVLPLADFYRRKEWSTLDIPLSLPVFDPFFEGATPAFGGTNTSMLRITAKDPDGGHISAETNLDAIFFYLREFSHIQGLNLSLAPHEYLEKVGNDFIFDSGKERINLDLIVNFSPSNASNKQIDWIYDANLAEIKQSGTYSPTAFTFRPLVADTVVTLQVRSQDGNHLSNILSIRIPSTKPRGISLHATAVSPIDASTHALNYNDVISLSVSFDPPYTDNTDIIWTLTENRLQTFGIPAAEFLSVGDNIYAPQRYVRALLKESKIAITARSRNAPEISASFTFSTPDDDPSESPKNPRIVPLDDTPPIYGNTLYFRLDALPAYTTHRNAQWRLSSNPVNYHENLLGKDVASIITEEITNGQDAAICGIRINTLIDTTFYIFAQPPSNGPTFLDGRVPSDTIHIKEYLPTSIQLNEHYKIVSIKDTFPLTTSLPWLSGTAYNWSVEPPGVIKQLPNTSTYGDLTGTFTPVRSGVEARIILSLCSDPSIADTCIVSVPITTSITNYVVTHNGLANASNYTPGDTFLLHTQMEPADVRPAGFEWSFYPLQAVEIIETFPPFHDSIRIRPLLPQVVIATAHTVGSIRYAASHTLSPVLPSGQSLVIRDAYGQQQAEVNVDDELSLTADFAPNYALRWDTLSIDGTPSTAAVFVDKLDNAHTRTVRAGKANETVYITATASDVPDTPCGIFRLVIKRKPLNSLRIGRPQKPAAVSSHVLYRETVTLQAFAAPELTDLHPLVWSISPKGIAEFTGDNDADPYNYTRTVRAVSSNDSCIVTAQTADGSFIAHHAIVVPPVPLDSVSLINPLTHQSILSLVKEVGDTVFLNAELFPAHGICSTVRWTLEPLGIARFVKTTTSPPLECAVKILKPNSNVTVKLAVDNLVPVTHAITFSSIQSVALQRVNGTSLRSSLVADPVVVLQVVAQPPEANLANIQWSIEPPSAASFVDDSEKGTSLRTVRINDTQGQEAFVYVKDPQTGISANFPLHNPTLVSYIALQAEATTISHGTTVRLHADISPQEANQSIVWAARNLKTHQLLPIIAYPEGDSPDAILGIAEPNQQILVTATAADGSGRVASTFITSKPVSLERLKLVHMDKNGIPQEGSTADVHSGDTLFIVADVYPASAAPNGLLWSIDPVHAARFLDAVPVGTPYLGANIRKVEIRSSGGEEIRVSVVHPTDITGSQTASFTLNVAEPPEPPVEEPEEPKEGSKVTGIVLIDENERQAAEVSRGANVTLSAILHPKNVIVQNVKWTITPASAMDWTASSSTSLTRTFTALTPNTTVTITASTIDGEPKSATYTLRILPLPVASVSLQNISLNEGNGFAPGSSVTIQATILPMDASDRRLQWTVSPAGVAEYDPAVTTAAFILTPLFHDTTLVVTATSYDGSGRTATLSFTTTPAPPPTSIPASISAASPSVDYHNGYLQLFNLDGYLCRLTTLTGSTLSLFQSFSPNYIHHYPLSSGIYLLSVQKESITSTFKFLVK
jgi:hypothetical protein